MYNDNSSLMNAEDFFLFWPQVKILWWDQKSKEFKFEVDGCPSDSLDETSTLVSFLNSAIAPEQATGSLKFLNHGSRSVAIAIGFIYSIFPNL